MRLIIRHIEKMKDQFSPDHRISGIDLHLLDPHLPLLLYHAPHIRTDIRYIVILIKVT